MKFFFPDSQDQIDPNFDFGREESLPHRIRQRDDRYAHEVLGHAPYDGILLSKAVVDGISSAGKYASAHRGRLYREGIAKFLRLDASEQLLETMGDCGAFAYAREPKPPYTADQVIDFYEACGVDSGFSVDHVILGFDAAADTGRSGVDREWRRRQVLTIELAIEFLRRHTERGCTFEPIGVAQGWSPSSYAKSVAALQAAGYSRIALGGMVPLKTHEILACLDVVATVLDAGVEMHLLGVTRLESISRFGDYGVTSFDSTSPFRQAFMDADDNYYTPGGAFCAIRVPQSDGNPTLRNRVTAGQLPQDEVRALEDEALARVRAYARHKAALGKALDAVCAYEEFVTERPARRADYERTLGARPWEACGCQVCEVAGVEVILFRGTERNKRRGFHNLKVFRERLDQRLKPQLA
jgi:hypothetical protein